jgi:hypothetical protein
VLRETPAGAPEHGALAALQAACEGFDAWDRFAHEAALETLRRRDVAPAMGRWLPRLLVLAGKSRASGYEAVWDVLANAERRLAERRFDDCLARLYRLTEMLAQTRLRVTHRIERACTSGGPAARRCGRGSPGG